MFPSFFNRTLAKNYIDNGETLTCDNIIINKTKGIPHFAASGSYASLFGDQWKRYKKTQLDSYTGVPLSQNRLERCLGPLSDQLSGKMVLEAGCGAGRFTEILLKKGAYVVSSDLSTAVEVNAENFPISDHHLVIQADINDMPYADNSFDVVVCMGVIQHTPDSAKTIFDLYHLVKPGGTLVIDHYTITRSQFLRTSWLYRRTLKKKSADETIAYTEKLVKRDLPIHKKLARNPILSAIFNRISPVVSYYKSLPVLNDKQQEEWAQLDTHDSLTDWHKRFINRKPLIKILKSTGGIDISCEYGGNGLEARCTKPLNKS